MDEGRAGRIFQAGHKNCRAADAALCKPIQQGIDGGGLRALEKRAVENQAGVMLARCHIIDACRR